MVTTKKETLAGLDRAAKSVNVLKNVRNSFKIEYEDGSTGYRLHKTDVVTVLKNGNVRLNSGGCHTVTTKDRINQFLYSYGWHIRQQGGVWYVSTPIGVFDFYDGITFNVHGALIGKAKKIDLKKIDKLKKEINKFVSKVDTLDKLPEPNGGDCWDCSFVTSDGQTMGDLSNSDHLLSHVKEGYLHGHLIMNALKSAGYRDEQLPYVWRIKDIVKRSLRKYLQKKLISDIAVK